MVNASYVWRWVQAYAPEINRRCRPHLKQTNKSYRIDETYRKIKGQDRYLYRAVDSTGQTIDFLLTANVTRTLPSASFGKCSVPKVIRLARVINVDKNPAYPAAVRALKAEGKLPRRVRLRQCRYLNNVVEQDRRWMKKRCGSPKRTARFKSAWRTLQGIEAMNLIRK